VKFIHLAPDKYFSGCCECGDETSGPVATELVGYVCSIWRAGFLNPPNCINGNILMVEMFDYNGPKHK
jgi:hypothetical protein